MFSSRRIACIVLIAASICLFPLQALAQDQNNPEVIRKELNDTLAQLKAAQDRKNELATENEKLKAQIAAMQKDVDECHRASASWAEQTYFLRAQHSAWSVFLERYPAMKIQWEAFLEAGAMAMNNTLPEWHDHADVAAAPTSPSAPAPPASAPTLATAPSLATSPTTGPSTAPASNGNMSPMTETR